LGKKRFLKDIAYRLFKLFKQKLISRTKKIKFMGEIVTTAACCFGITLFGLGLGFVFLQVQANT
jgi:PetM family of cytochrome b6f complex subunit 7